MKYHWYELIQLFAATATYPLILLCIVWRGNLRKLSGVFSLSILELFKAVTCLLHIAGLITYHTYWYCYWPATAAIAAAGFGVAADILRDIPLANLTPKFARYTLLCFGILSGAAAFGLAYLDRPSHGFIWVDIVTQMDHFTALAWFAIALAMLLRIPWMGFAWTPNALALTIGFLLRVAATSAITYYAKGAHKATYLLLSFANDSINTFIAIYWFHTLLQPATKMHTQKSLAPQAARIIEIFSARSSEA